MWFAEVAIESRKDFPSNIGKVISARLSSVHTDLEVTSRTVYSGDQAVVKSIICSYLDHNCAYFIVMDFSNRLTIHFERLDPEGTLADLKTSLVGTVRGLLRILKNENCTVASVNGSVKLRQRKVNTFEFRKLSIWNRFESAILSNLLAKTYVPIATLIASITLNPIKVNEAAISVVAAVIAMVIWIPFEAVTMKQYSFKEVV